jgi:hypothetical protein
MTPETPEEKWEELNYSFDSVRTVHGSHVEVNGWGAFSKEASWCVLVSIVCLFFIFYIDTLFIEWICMSILWTRCNLIGRIRLITHVETSYDLPQYGLHFSNFFWLYEASSCFDCMRLVLVLIVWVLFLFWLYEASSCFYRMRLVLVWLYEACSCFDCMRLVLVLIVWGLFKWNLFWFILCDVVQTF